MLQLVSCNMTTIPKFLMQVNHLQILDLSSNKIHGTIPKWICERWDDSLTRLNLSYNMFTYMQLSSYVLPHSRLESLDLSFNRIQGQIPMPSMLTTANGHLQALDYSNNRFSNVISNFTAYLSQTGYLKMSKNNINWHIPDSIVIQKTLKSLTCHITTSVG